MYEDIAIDIPRLLIGKKVSAKNSMWVYFNGGCNNKDCSKSGTCGYYVFAPDGMLMCSHRLYLGTGYTNSLLES